MVSFGGKLRWRYPELGLVSAADDRRVWSPPFPPFPSPPPCTTRAFTHRHRTNTRRLNATACPHRHTLRPNNRTGFQAVGQDGNTLSLGDKFDDGFAIALIVRQHLTPSTLKEKKIALVFTAPTDESSEVRLVQRASTMALPCSQHQAVLVIRDTKALFALTKTPLGIGERDAFVERTKGSIAGLIASKQSEVPPPPGKPTHSPTHTLLRPTHHRCGRSTRQSRKKLRLPRAPRRALGNCAKSRRKLSLRLQIHRLSNTRRTPTIKRRRNWFSPGACLLPWLWPRAYLTTVRRRQNRTVSQMDAALRLAGKSKKGKKADKAKRLAGFGISPPAASSSDSASESSGEEDSAADKKKKKKKEKEKKRRKAHKGARGKSKAAPRGRSHKRSRSPESSPSESDRSQSPHRTSDRRRAPHNNRSHNQHHHHRGVYLSQSRSRSPSQPQPVQQAYLQPVQQLYPQPFSGVGATPPGNLFSSTQPYNYPALIPNNLFASPPQRPPAPALQPRGQPGMGMELLPMLSMAYQMGEQHSHGAVPSEGASPVGVVHPSGCFCTICRPPVR
jgi:hypothetical protein